MQIKIPSFGNGESIPTQYAYAKIDNQNHTKPSQNINPQIIWSDLPKGTKSLVLICVDDCVPTEFNHANKEGKHIPKEMPRKDFYHWVLIDIDPKRGEITEGEDSRGITEGGKKPGKKQYGISGINNYSSPGELHGGYDGPCPPWNDELMHHYHFRLYALDVESLNLSDNFTGPDVIKAMEGHILDRASWMGAYTLNPELN